jgi:hypothetical protein
MTHRPINIAPPRPLNSQEFGILNHLLSVNFPGRLMLKKQTESARVSEECEDCRTIKIIVDRISNNVATVKRRIPIEADANDIDGVKIHYLLHVVNGFIDELEIFREDSMPIKEFPEPSLLTIINIDDDPS